MPCSAVTLSVATIFAIFSSTLLALAFSTDNWLNFDVKRSNIQVNAVKLEDSESIFNAINQKYYFFSRTKGLFRICYPKERPPASAVPTYLSPTETHCSNIDYFPYGGSEKSTNGEASSRLYLARSCIMLFITSFILIFCAFWTGLSGCWKRSTTAITATSILFLVASLVAGAAMAVWHTVEFFEKERVMGEEYFHEWNPILKSNTVISYDWSYVMAWVGTATCLIAAILFSGAAVCLRGEREKEEHLNLQYLMPVYPQKQQAYPQFASYPQPQIYSGSYYHGNQYGQYSY